MSEDVAILGATASGKTALAVALARAVDGFELASVDAFACYKRLDIGTAKPRAPEREGLCWHLIDLVEPTSEFSVADFATTARERREIIHGRGHRVCYVGGSGLYLRSVLDGLSPPPRFNEVADELQRRAELPGGLEALYLELQSIDPLGATRMEPSNRRRVLRALEVSLGSGRPFSSFGPGMEVYPEIDCQLVGLHFERGELDARIASRLEAQLEQGFEDEVRALVDEGIALSRTAFQAIGYREMLEVVRGTMTIHDATAEILRRSRRLARRQLAWLRRDPRITWMDATTPDLEHRLIELVGARDSTARR